jgi:hypothetical protein
VYTDPLAEKFPNASPYNYCLGNPINLIDPDGRAPKGTDPPGSVSNPIPIQQVNIYGSTRSSKGCTSEINSISLINRNINSAIIKNQSSSTVSSVGTAIADVVGTALFGVNSKSTDRYEGVANTGRYSPGNSGLVALGIIGAPFVIAALAPEAIAVGSAVTLESAAVSVGTNVFSQYVANGGNFGDINGIEAASSIVPAIGPTIFGETFSYTYNEGFQVPNSFEKWSVQVGGGIFSTKFGNASENYLKGEKGGSAVSSYFNFLIETGSNAAPNVIKDK